MFHLSAPEFDSPVKRGGDEEMGEVNRSTSTVTAEPCHRTMVAFKHFCDTCLTVTHTHTRLFTNEVPSLFVSHKVRGRVALASHGDRQCRQNHPHSLPQNC